jgi:hypothetical protein
MVLVAIFVHMRVVATGTEEAVTDAHDQWRRGLWRLAARRRPSGAVPNEDDPHFYMLLL